MFEVSRMTMTGNEPEEEAAHLGDIHHYAGVLVIFRRRSLVGAAELLPALIICG